MSFACGTWNINLFWSEVGANMNYMVNASTDVGTARKQNQDSVLIQIAGNGVQRMLLAAVCDGMGGLSDGEVAGTTVVCALKSWFAYQCDAIHETKNIKTLSSSCAQMLNRLNQSLQEYEARTRKIMGTTMSCLIALDNEYSLIHIGDSRIYRIREQATQLTTDHTVVSQAMTENRMTPEQARLSKDRHKLTQCIGASKRYEPEICFGKILPEDVFLLCSDGFWHHLTTEEMQEWFAPQLLLSESVIKERCEKAIRCAIERKEQDNISVAVIKAL